MSAASTKMPHYRSLPFPSLIHEQSRAAGSGAVGSFLGCPGRNFALPKRFATGLVILGQLGLHYLLRLFLLFLRARVLRRICTRLLRRERIRAANISDLERI